MVGSHRFDQRRRSAHLGLLLVVVTYEVGVHLYQDLCSQMVVTIYMHMHRRSCGDAGSHSTVLSKIPVV